MRRFSERRIMTPVQQRESAQIIPFQPRLRSVPQRREDRLEAEAMALPKIVCGGSWYHETAIEEAVRPAKR
jgi:hypothetical protein